MPADVQKSIEISMKADLKDLTSQLKKIPGLTAKEAKAMTSALQKELKQAQREAQKTAKVNKKSMQEIGKATKKAGKATKNMRLQTREAGAAMGGMKTVVSAVNPELAGMAMMLGTVGQGARAMSRSLATGNPVLMILIGIIATITAGYTLFTASTKKAEAQQKLLKEATKAMNTALAKQAQLIRGISADYVNAERDLLVFTGQMSEHEADIAKLRESNQKSLDKDLQGQKTQIDSKRDLLKLVRKIERTQNIAVGKLTEEQKKQLETAMLLTEERTLQNGLATTSAGLEAQMFLLGKFIREDLERETKIRDRIRETRGQELEKSLQLLQYQKELADEAEAEAEREKKRQAWRASAAKRKAAIEATSNNLATSRKKVEGEIYQSSLKQMNSGEQIETKYKKQLEVLEEQRQAILDQYDTTEAIAKTASEKKKIDEINLESARAVADLDTREHQIKLERDQELAELAEKRGKEREKAAKNQAKIESALAEKLIKQQEATLQTTIGGMQQFATNGLQLLEMTENKNRDLINFLFRINQAAAIADIAMSTAKAIARAPADYGPGAPLAIAAITAGSAAQAAIVLAQKPPLHMGGIVQPLAPDEQQRTVLTGESVLDRATTRRLGEDGIQRLQEGKSAGPEIIVMNPFKHLDRYTVQR